MYRGTFESFIFLFCQSWARCSCVFATPFPSRDRARLASARLKFPACPSDPGWKPLLVRLALVVFDAALRSVKTRCIRTQQLSRRRERTRVGSVHLMRPCRNCPSTLSSRLCVSTATPRSSSNRRPTAENSRVLDMRAPLLRLRHRYVLVPKSKTRPLTRFVFQIPPNPPVDRRLSRPKSSPRSSPTSRSTTPRSSPPPSCSASGTNALPPSSMATFESRGSRA